MAPNKSSFYIWTVRSLYTSYFNITLSVYNRPLEKTDPYSTRVFLQRHEQYFVNVIAPAKQISAGSKDADISTT